MSLYPRHWFERPLKVICRQFHCPLYPRKRTSAGTFHNLMLCESDLLPYGACPVRFTLESEHVRCKHGCPLWAKSGHVQCTRRCPLCANSGHSTAHSITSSAICWRYMLSRAASTKRCHPIRARQRAYTRDEYRRYRGSADALRRKMAVAILTSVFVEILSALNSLGNSNVRFGSEADMRPSNSDVGFTPESGHCLRLGQWAKSPRHHRHSPFLISPRRRLNLFPCAL